MGCSQVVRHRTLTPLFVGSSPTTPENQILYFLPTGKTFLKKPLQVVFIGLVAQWIRARGYEPRCQGFESLLARYNKLILFRNFTKIRFFKLVWWVDKGLDVHYYYY